MPAVSLRLKVLLVFLLAAALPLAGMTWFGATQTRAALEDQVAKSSLDVADAAAAYTDLHFRNTELLVDQAAQDTQLRRGLRTGQNASLQLAVTSLHESGRGATPATFDATFLLDADGTLLAAHPDNRTDTNVSLAHTDAYRAPVTRGEPQVTSLLNTSLQKHPGVAVVAPVFVNGTIQGVLGGFVDVPAFGDHLQQFTHSGSETIYLTQSDGRILYHANATRVPHGTDLRNVTPVARGLAGDAGTVEFSTPDDDTVHLAAYAPLPRLGWVLVNTMPAADAYAGAHAMTNLLFTGSALVLGFSVAGGIAVASHVARPVRRLQRAAETIEGGRLDVRVPERGGDELAALGRSFNRMATALATSLTGLRRSEERYRGLVENSSDLILTLTPAGDVAFVNRPAQEALGRVATELEGESFLDLVHPEDRRDVEHALRDVTTTGSPWHNVAHRLVPRDGGARYCLTTLTPVGGFHDTDDVRILTVARDVTAAMRDEATREQLYAAARLVSQETRMDALLHRGLQLLREPTETPVGGVFLHDPDGLHLAAHHGLAADGPVPVHTPPTAGDGDAHDPATDGHARIHPVHRLRALDPYGRELTDHGITHVYTVPLIERGETLGWMFLGPADTSADALPDDDRRLLDALAAQLAVGVRRARFEASLRDYANALEQKVAERTRELSEKNREIEAFLYSVSHDLKAPLISIQGYLNALDEEYAERLGDDGRFYLERLRRNADGMEGLILDLLELSRIGRVDTDARPVDLDATLRDVLDTLDDRLRAVDATVHADPLPTIPGQPDRLRQLLHNLVENAAKYRDPDRPLHLRVTARHDDAADAWTLAVEDNGLGIPATARDRVFQLFQRFHATTHPDVQGTGMGLAIVHRITTAHGGTVDVESREGEGTRFLVTLPATPKIAPDAPPETEGS